MTTHGIFIPDAIAAKDIDAFNRTAISGVDFDSGNICILSGKSSTSGEAEVWTAIAPSTGNGLTGVWMVYDPELVWTGSYRGLDPDVRNFYVAAGKTFSIFKPQLEDVFTLTGDSINGSKSSNTFLNATNTGGKQLAWAANAGSSVFAAQLLATTWVSIGTGAMDSQRVTAYQFRVVAL